MVYHEKKYNKIRKAEMKDLAGRKEIGRRYDGIPCALKKKEFIRKEKLYG
jgi:hypothetical protein